MKSKKLKNNIVLFTFPNEKEMTLAFCRMQEYYESPIPALYRKKFSLYDFLNASMMKDGVIEYFSVWSGFNIPGDILNIWRKLHENELTPGETAIFNALNKHKINPDEKYYIIGAKENDKAVLKHEIAHALYYTNNEYMTKMSDLVSDLQKNQSKIYKSMKSKLLKMGYNKEVINDEVQAYLSSETPKYLMEIFNTDISGVETIKKMRKVLSEYNTL
jgi:hypothetical protein